MNVKIAIVTGIFSLTTWTLMSGPVIVVQPPSIAVQVPAPAPPVVTVEAGVPDSYVWDGYEFVGVVGTQYYYLGPDHVWLAFDAPRFARFHEWERGHADWRTHAIHNELYRRDIHGHDVPRHDDHAHDVSGHTVDHHDAGNQHDHDKDYDH